MPKDNFNIDTKDIKIRKHFKRDPSEKVEMPKKGAPYSRAQAKREWQEALEEEADDLDINI